MAEKGSMESTDRIEPDRKEENQQEGSVLINMTKMGKHGYNRT